MAKVFGQRTGPANKSASHEQIRFVKSLYAANVRRRERLFAAEGVRLVEEALGAGVRPELVLVSPEQLTRTSRGAALYARLKSFPWQTVTEPVLKSITDTETPQGVVAVLPIPPLVLPTDLGPIVLILDRLRDPGNAGATLRSAVASGVSRAVAFVDSVDAYSAKVVRAAMGAHFHLTIIEDATWKSLLPILGSRQRYLASATAGTDYDQVDWSRPCALILGGEAEGAGDDAEFAANARVTIPMRGPAESLNAAIAGSILLFEAARARRTEGSASKARQFVAPVITPPLRTPFARSFDRERRAP
ncbi:MAG TPA: RNA methyltransferase [Chloroflexota bacterium]|nr:RNA methyltransferase [Chloroflexota bacterium]